MAGEVINLATFQLDTQKLQSNLSDLQDSYFDLRKEQKAYADEAKQAARQISILEKSQKALTAAAGDNSAAIEANDKELQELNKTQREAAKSEQNLAIQIGTVKKEINQTTTQLRAYQDAEGKTTSLIDLANQAIERQIVNKNDAKAANIALNTVSNQLNPNIAEEAELLIRVNDQIDKNTAFITENSSKNAQRIAGIGRYTESIQEAFKETGLMNNALSQLGAGGKVAEIGFKTVKGAVDDVKDAFTNFKTTREEAKVAQEKYNALNKISTEATKQASEAEATATKIGFQYAQGKATQTEVEAANTIATNANRTATTAQVAATEASVVATNASSASLKLLRVALMSTGIGAIVIVLGSLIAYMASTQEGIDKVTSVTRPLQAVLQSVLGVVQRLGKSLFETFTNPKKALIDLVNFLQTNLINRFKAFGVILDGIINLDFRKVTNGVLQAGTGVENVIGKVKELGKQTGQFFDEALKKGSDLDKLQKQLERTRINNRVEIGRLTEEIKKQNAAAEDQTKTLAQREAGAANSIKAARELNGLRQKELDLEIAIVKNNQSRNDTSREEEQQLAELIAKKNESNASQLELETTQNNKLNSIRKEAAAKQKEIQDKATEQVLNRSKNEIDLFIANQGFKKKSLEEEFEFNKQLYDRELADLKLQLQKKKLTQQEFDIQRLELVKKFGLKNAELTIENAQLEIDAELEKNQRILDSDKFLSESQLALKQQALSDNLKAEEDFQKLRLENGIINEAEYNAEINRINEENRVSNEELRIQREAVDRERQLIDLENQKIAQEENFIAQAEIETQQNEIKRQQEITNAEQTGASIADINAKYAQLDKQIEEQKNANKLQLASQTFGNLAAIFGEESKAGKAAAIAQTTIDTYQAATAAYKSLAGIPIVGPALGGVAAAAAVVSGIANVKKITATKQPSFKKPSYASGMIGLRGIGTGTSDDIQANLSAGESIINARSTSMFARELSAINQAGGGVGINGTSNILNQNEIQTNANNSQMALMIAEAVAVGAEKGTKQGSQTGIRELSDDRKVMSDAKF